MKLKDPGILAAIVASCAALTIAGGFYDWALLVWIFKPLATATIALAAWRRGLLLSRYSRFIVAGLVFSLAGDVFLITPEYFVFGLLAFLIAHMCYLAAFTADVRLGAYAKPFMAVAVIATVAVFVIWPGVESELQLPVIAYVLVLAMMTAQAQARSFLRGTYEARRAALGGALFLISDLILAIDKFHSPVAGAAFWVLATYWSAQTLIALSVPREDLD
ncbi:MAG: lysoplasmalogenase [Burkholderiaceae bacterium]|nr:lysoplasmalogenase [Burkholderiaceae bacterium]